jgi:hypothetical protein
MPDSRRAASTYGTSVFVNCPFDDAYAPIFDAIVFALLDCGFTPRCALEVDDAGLVRFEKILQLVKACRFGIHDISRTELDRRNRLPRFNMPLELGLFLVHNGSAPAINGARRASCSTASRTAIRSSFPTLQAKTSSRTTPGRTWLTAAAKPDLALPGGSAIAQRYGRFRSELPELCRRLRLRPTEMTFVDYCSIAAEWLAAATIQPKPAGARDLARPRSKRTG